ncbi:MAG: hypothetical protein ABSG15_03735 [FCB group bacterium]|jgi:hypothetical protein
MENQFRKISSILHIILILLFILSALSIYSCNKLDMDEPTPPPPVIGGCDTTNVSYSAFIKTTLVKNCTSSGCHSTASGLGGTVLLITYDNIKSAGLSGNLLKGIKGTMGAYIIPQSDLGCDILKFQAWVNKGALNN